MRVSNKFRKTICQSLDKNRPILEKYNFAPVLGGFYSAHIDHYPIRIKPDDIWLLIVQAFSNHVNLNSEDLRKYFVNFTGKKSLVCSFILDDSKQINQKIASDFSAQINSQMEKYLGKELLNTLTPNFTTTDYNSTIIFKISIMNAFKKYFEYKIFGMSGCGIPYIILEGTFEDYENIISKAIKLKKYKFSWYIDRIIPHIKKMAEAKKGKIDTYFFQNIIQKSEVTEWAGGMSGIGGHDIKVDVISGWFLNFFAYDSKGNKLETDSIKIKELSNLADQMLNVPFEFYSQKKKLII